MAAFVHLASRGAEGSFTATYRVFGTGWYGQGAGVLDVAQSAEATMIPAPWGGGQSSIGAWSYRLTLEGGADIQWIERGERALACWRLKLSAMTCHGPGAFEPSIGSSLATDPFLPETALAEIQGVTRGTTGVRPNRITIFAEPGNRVSGQLDCMRDLNGAGSGTWCLRRSGLLASFVGTAGVGPFSMVALTSTAPRPGASDLR